MIKSKSDYSKKLLDPRWQKMRLEILNRDNWTCVQCGNKDQTLHAHHTYYEDGNIDPWEYETTWLITLCSDCHSEYHKNKYRVEKELLNSINRCGFSLKALSTMACGFDILSWENDKSKMEERALIISNLICDSFYKNKTLNDVYKDKLETEEFDIRNSFISDHVETILSEEE